MFRKRMWESNIFFIHRYSVLYGIVTAIFLATLVRSVDYTSDLEATNKKFIEVESQFNTNKTNYVSEVGDEVKKQVDAINQKISELNKEKDTLNEEKSKLEVKYNEKQEKEKKEKEESKKQ